MLAHTISSLITYINHFEIADYIAFMWFILLSFLFLCLAILLLKRFALLALILLMVVFGSFIIGPFGIKYFLNANLRSNEANITSTKQLSFSDTFILKGKVKNTSKKSFKFCKITIGFHKYTKDSLKKFINKIKPYKKESIELKKALQTNQSADFKIVLHGFKIKKDTNISILSECYR